MYYFCLVVLTLMAYGLSVTLCMKPRVPLIRTALSYFLNCILLFLWVILWAVTQPGDSSDPCTLLATIWWIETTRETNQESISKCPMTISHTSFGPRGNLAPLIDSQSQTFSAVPPGHDFLTPLIFQHSFRAVSRKYVNVSRLKWGNDRLCVCVFRKYLLTKEAREERYVNVR